MQVALPLAPCSAPRIVRRSRRKVRVSDLERAVQRSDDPLLRWMLETVMDALDEECGAPRPYHQALHARSAERGEVGTVTDHPPPVE